ncbi:MAG: hypothetical protein ABH863_01000, partial [Candidatus Micrarchaeota archaeon]
GQAIDKMADEFRDELISISEKLAKYNIAMQESLNILSDEFLLLRDELSTLNQNLEKSKALDSKLEEFNKTVVVLERMKDSFSTLEKVSESLQIANELGSKVDALAKKGGDSGQLMADAVLPLSKKMDLLYSKFDEQLVPFGKKMEALSQSFKEEVKETSDAVKAEEELKSLALSIQDELAKMQKAFSEQGNAVRSVGTSIAYLSETEAELKKSLDGLSKIYEQDRERAAAERAKAETEAKKRGGEASWKKLDEIAALLKVQMEGIERQESALEEIKNAGKKAGGEGDGDEFKKYFSQIGEIQQQLSDQAKALGDIRGSIPTGNFEEVIKHADLINQATNNKLESISELETASTKAVEGFSDKMGQLPALMQGISSALDMLVQEMKKSQAEYKSLQATVQSMKEKADEPGGAHIEKLETISQNLRGLHTKIDTQVQTQQQQQPPQQFEAKLDGMREELRKFTELERQRMQTLPKEDGAAKPDVFLEQLKRIEMLLTEQKKSGAENQPASPGQQDPFMAELKKIEEMMSRYQQPKDAVSVSPELEALLKKMDALSTQMKEASERISAMPPTSGPSQQAPESGGRLDAQMISIKKELSNVSQNVISLKEALTQGVDISTEVDFAPVLKRIDELQGKFESAPHVAETVSGGIVSSAGLPGEKILDQRQILEEVQQNVRIFETFELSDRAKIVVDRISMLVKRAISIYSVG